MFFPIKVCVKHTQTTHKRRCDVSFITQAMAGIKQSICSFISQFVFCCKFLIIIAMGHEDWRTVNVFPQTILRHRFSVLEILIVASRLVLGKTQFYYIGMPLHNLDPIET